MATDTKNLPLDQKLVDEAYEMMDGHPNKTSKWERWKSNFKKRGWILLFILPALIYIIIFCYIPMYGILVAFQDYMPGDQIVGSETVWVGFKNFMTFFSNPNFWKRKAATFCITSSVFNFFIFARFSFKRAKIQ